MDMDMYNITKQQQIIDNQIIKYNRVSLVINNIVTFKPWIGYNFKKIIENFKRI